MVKAIKILEAIKPYAFWVLALMAGKLILELRDNDLARILNGEGREIVFAIVLVCLSIIIAVPVLRKKYVK